MIMEFPKQGLYTYLYIDILALYKLHCIQNRGVGENEVEAEALHFSTCLLQHL